MERYGAENGLSNVTEHFSPLAAVAHVIVVMSFLGQGTDRQI